MEETGQDHAQKKGPTPVFYEEKKAEGVDGQCQKLPVGAHVGYYYHIKQQQRHKGRGGQLKHSIEHQGIEHQGMNDEVSRVIVCYHTYRQHKQVIAHFKKRFGYAEIYQQLVEIARIRKPVATRFPTKTIVKYQECVAYKSKEHSVFLNCILVEHFKIGKHGEEKGGKQIHRWIC